MMIFLCCFKKCSSAEVFMRGVHAIPVEITGMSAIWIAYINNAVVRVTDSQNTNGFTYLYGFKHFIFLSACSHFPSWHFPTNDFTRLPCRALSLFRCWKKNPNDLHNALSYVQTAWVRGQPTKKKNANRITLLPKCLSVLFSSLWIKVCKMKSSLKLRKRRSKSRKMLINFLYERNYSSRMSVSWMWMSTSTTELMPKCCGLHMNILPPTNTIHTHSPKH